MADFSGYLEANQAMIEAKSAVNARLETTVDVSPDANAPAAEKAGFYKAQAESYRQALETAAPKLETAHSYIRGTNPNR